MGCDHDDTECLSGDKDDTAGGGDLQTMTTTMQMMLILMLLPSHWHSFFALSGDDDALAGVRGSCAVGEELRTSRALHLLIAHAELEGLSAAASKLHTQVAVCRLNV